PRVGAPDPAHRRRHPRAWGRPGRDRGARGERPVRLGRRRDVRRDPVPRLAARARPRPPALTQDERKHSMSDPRVWLITGASSGFGRAIAGAALARGDAVVATARRADTLGDLDGGDRVHVVSLDVTDAAQREAAIAQALERFGRIDVLVNNAGRTQVGAVEETTDDELRALFELHFFGPAALTRLVLPLMRRQGGAAIVQMSSVGGQVTAPGFGAYCATKFALEGLTETLRDEVEGFGIRTLIVEPGA